MTMTVREKVTLEAATGSNAELTGMWIILSDFALFSFRMTILARRKDDQKSSKCLANIYFIIMLYYDIYIHVDNATDMQTSGYGDENLIYY